MRQQFRIQIMLHYENVPEGTEGLESQNQENNVKDVWTGIKKTGFQVDSGIQGVQLKAVCMCDTMAMDCDILLLQ